MSALLYEDAAFHVNSTLTTNLCISQTTPAAPSTPPPPPRLLRGIFPPYSPGGGVLAIFRCPGVGICQPRGHQRDFWHSRSFQSEYNYTEDLTGKTSRLAHLSRRARITEDCKSMFSFLCMYSFIAYQARII